LNQVAESILQDKEDRKNKT